MGSFQGMNREFSRGNIRKGVIRYESHMLIGIQVGCSFPLSHSISLS